MAQQACTPPGWAGATFQQGDFATVNRPAEATASAGQGQRAILGQIQIAGEPTVIDTQLSLLLRLGQAAPASIHLRRWRACHSGLIPAHCPHATRALGCHLPCAKVLSMEKNVVGGAGGLS
jgi:hypothetical protein